MKEELFGSNDINQANAQGGWKGKDDMTQLRIRYQFIKDRWINIRRKDGEKMKMESGMVKQVNRKKNKLPKKSSKSKKPEVNFEKNNCEEEEKPKKKNRKGKAKNSL